LHDDLYFRTARDRRSDVAGGDPLGNLDPEHLNDEELDSLGRVLARASDQHDRDVIEAAGRRQRLTLRLDGPEFDP
jgi:hypothetical protein